MILKKKILSSQWLKIRVRQYNLFIWYGDKEDKVSTLDSSYILWYSCVNQSIFMPKLKQLVFAWINQNFFIIR